jgi:tetratricopeptide (TPR) repeat protein
LLIWCPQPGVGKDESIAGVLNSVIEEKSDDPHTPEITKAVYSKSADQCVKAYFLGNKPEAEKYFKEVLAPVKNSYPAVGAVITQIHGRVVMYSEKEDVPKCYGLCMYESMLTVIERTLGRNHTSVAAALDLIARYYDDLHDYKNAIAVRERQMRILRRAGAEDWRQTQEVLQNLAYDYCLIKDYKTAQKLLDENVTVCKRKNLTATLQNAERLQIQIKRHLDNANQPARRSR